MKSRQVSKIVKICNYCSNRIKLYYITKFKHKTFYAYTSKLQIRFFHVSLNDPVALHQCVGLFDKYDDLEITEEDDNEWKKDTENRDQDKIDPARCTEYLKNKKTVIKF